MNLAAHRLIFNPHRGQFMPVAEIARSHGKDRREGFVKKVGKQARRLLEYRAQGRPKKGNDDE